MVDAKQLLAGLKRPRRTLEAHLRVQHRAPTQRDAAEAEWREALDARRTADTFETFCTVAHEHDDVSRTRTATCRAQGCRWRGIMTESRWLRQYVLRSQPEPLPDHPTWRSLPHL